MGKKEEVLMDCLGLSSGTMATLTGKRKYTDLEKAQAKFVAFVKRSPKTYDNWQEAWNGYVARRKK